MFDSSKLLSFKLKFPNTTVPLWHSKKKKKKKTVPLWPQYCKR